MHNSSFSRRRNSALAAIVLLIALALVPGAAPALAAPTALPNFQLQPVFTGLKNPIDFAFASDGRVFVAEKAGLIKVFDSLSDPQPDVFADLQTNVYKGPNDHGLLGLALDPDFPATPYVYTLYTYDAPIGGTAPTWSDVCNDPPGPNKNGCVVSGRLSRLQANGNAMVGNEQVLVNGWCQQFTSHSIGALGFGADGALYASAGEGANTSSGDYGQIGATNLITYTEITPVNPCGDPPTAAGVKPSLPSARGGALRAQSLRRPAGEPALLSGTVIRVDPATGAGLPDNPLAASADTNARRIVAYGLRNPFRFTIRPGTSEIWLGDVGWGRWEEIDRVANINGAAPLNFGWPCYEGPDRQPVYDGFNLTLCESLYAQAGAVTAPYHAISHRESLQPGDTCTDAAPCTSAISGLAFYAGGNYPASYDGALFFADYGRHGIWSMLAGANGLPDPATRTPFITGAQAPVSMKTGPGGDLFYADITGTIYRVSYFAGNQPPVAKIKATPTSGPAPLQVAFDARDSSDSDGDVLSYAWDLDGDGQYDDSTAAQPNYTYHQVGTYMAGLKVTDPNGASHTSSLAISVGNTPPVAMIDTPLAATRWKVGDRIIFSGHATDPQQGPLSPDALTWTVVMHHCYRPGDCHEHLMEELSGAGGSFVTEDHENLPIIELRLTATDQGGLSSSASVVLNPYTTTLSLQSSPSSASIVLDTDEVTTPATIDVVAGSTHTLIAPGVQDHRSFVGWADGTRQLLRQVKAASTPLSYTAMFGNHAPVAAFGVAPAGVRAAQFDGSLSSDLEGDSLQYAWSFGDGATASAEKPLHAYAQAGVYRVVLTVRDQLGISASRHLLINVREDGVAVVGYQIWIPVTRH